MLLAAAVAGIVALVVLVAWVRLHAFIALMLTALGIGLAAGMPPPAIVSAFQTGVGNTLGFIAIVIALGSVLGRLLAESGGAQVVAKRVIGTLGGARLPWAVALVALVIGLPVFFSVGLVLLLPIVAGLSAASGRATLWLGIPLLAGLSASHGLVPPHPGPIAAIQLLNADTGRCILYGVVAAAVATIVAGPLFGLWIGHRVAADRTLPVAPPAAPTAGDAPARPPISFTAALVVLLLPVILMLAATAADMLLPPSRARAAIDFAGSPAVAMLLATIAGYHVFGTRRGFTRTDLLRFTEESLGPIASVLLIVGAGGGLGRVLDDAGVGRAMAAIAVSMHVPALVFGWAIAALLRVAVGSATVAVTTAAGIMAPIAAASPDVSRELLVVSVGAGSLIASHVNDGGFWLVKEFFQLTVVETFATWTVLETIVSVVGLAVVLVLSLLVT
jgi:gluconate:H+ symporter, GntP family